MIVSFCDVVPVFGESYSSVIKVHKIDAADISYPHCICTKYVVRNMPQLGNMTATIITIITMTNTAAYCLPNLVLYRDQ